MPKNNDFRRLHERPNLLPYQRRAHRRMPVPTLHTAQGTTGMSCRHVWVFTAPRHIASIKCPAIGRRNATKQERAEFSRGGWIYLAPLSRQG